MEQLLLAVACHGAQIAQDRLFELCGYKNRMRFGWFVLGFFVRDVGSSKVLLAAKRVLSKDSYPSRFHATARERLTRDPSPKQGDQQQAIRSEAWRHKRGHRQSFA